MNSLFHLSKRSQRKGIGSKRGSVEGAILASIAIPLILIGGTLLLQRQREAIGGEDLRDAAANNIYNLPVVSLYSGVPEPATDNAVTLMAAATKITNEAAKVANTQLVLLDPTAPVDKVVVVSEVTGMGATVAAGSFDLAACNTRLTTEVNLGDQARRRYVVSAFFPGVADVCATNPAGIKDGGAAPVVPPPVDTPSGSSSSGGSSGGGGGGGIDPENPCYQCGGGLKSAQNGEAGVFLVNLPAIDCSGCGGFLNQ